MRELQIVKIYKRNVFTGKVYNEFEIRELKTDWLRTILYLGLMGRWLHYKPLKWYYDSSGGPYSSPVRFYTIEKADKFLEEMKNHLHTDQVVGGVRF